MRSADSEQLHVRLLAPGGEEAQVGGVAAPGAAAVAGQETGNGGVGLQGVLRGPDGTKVVVMVMAVLPSSPGLEGR